MKHKNRSSAVNCRERFYHCWSGSVIKTDKFSFFRSVQDSGPDRCLKIAQGEEEVRFACRCSGKGNACFGQGGEEMVLVPKRFRCEQILAHQSLGGTGTEAGCSCVHKQTFRFGSKRPLCFARDRLIGIKIRLCSDAPQIGKPQCGTLFSARSDDTDAAAEQDRSVALVIADDTEQVLFGK